ncbi:GbsR/MarR family transcriptional regulator [Thermus amyloliquefaciens]|uniref:GbsR/MarR family transcriptional regulator n=1 Tax=Thermus amyloliquefaciens TaxID=1449080 RepID=UPI00056F73BB|nr:MarR family transcriptional regulator [Thermus amyloliquefaciens]
MDPALKHWVEETALLFESAGLPRMAGRVLAYLLVADPPEASAREISEVLSASKGALSPALNLLARLQLVERLRRPGERADRYTVRPGAWRRLLLEKARALALYREQAEKGLALVGEAKGRRLKEMRDLYAFFERELPKLLERFAEEA